MKRLPDYCTENGARELAGRILAYWRVHGGRLPRLAVKRVECKMAGKWDMRLWVVESDMRGGKPGGRTLKILRCSSRRRSGPP